MRCNGEALPGALQPGDLAVWDGHVAMVVDNGMTIEPMYQFGCRTTAVMPLPRPTPCVPRSQAFSPTVTCLYSAGLLAPTTGAEGTRGRTCRPLGVRCRTTRTPTLLRSCHRHGHRAVPLETSAIWRSRGTHPRSRDPAAVPSIAHVNIVSPLVSRRVPYRPTIRSDRESHTAQTTTVTVATRQPMVALLVSSHRLIQSPYRAPL